MKVKNDKIENKYVTGPIFKSIMSLMIPIMFGNLLQTAYNLTDTFWVGRLGKEAVAAVSICFPIIFLIISLSIGFATAGSILVSQAKGRKDFEAMNKITGQTLLMSVILSTFFSIIGFIFSAQLIGILGVEPVVSALATTYLKYSMLGLVFVFGYMTFQEISRGAGDPKTPLIIVLITVLLNLILDPLLIFGYKMIPAFGVSGAAVSTIATQAVAFIVALIIMKKGIAGIKLKRRHFKLNFKLIKKLFLLGIPTSLEQSSRSISMILMVIIASSFGTVVLAAFGIGSRIFSFVIIPAISLAISSAILVGQNIGAGKKRRAFKTGILAQKIGFISLTIVGIIFFIFAKQIATIFIPGEIETIAVATSFLKTISIIFGVIGVQMSCLGAFRGAGKTKLSMILAMTMISIQLISAYVLSHYTPLAATGIWVAFVVADVIGAGVTLSVYHRKKWLN